jgi:hypothetical protein
MVESSTRRKTRAIAVAAGHPGPSTADLADRPFVVRRHICILLRSHLMDHALAWGGKRAKNLNGCTRRHYKVG